MSGSVFLYLAIVVMWLCVLVPMWLRRDKAVMADAHESAEPYGPDEQAVDDESADAMADTVSVPMPSSETAQAEFRSESWSEPESRPEAEGEAEAGSDTRSEPLPGRSPGGQPTARKSVERRRAMNRRRALQVAKRRRLTFWCTLLLLASVVTAAVQVIPWWGVAPSVVLLGAYLAVLRVSVQIDAERRRAAAEARAKQAKRARRRAVELAELEARHPVAEIIDLAAHRDELFDQYAEMPRRAVGD
ncbi:hypothetical protein [Streptosporangium lutulentum]|uniref:Nucleotide-binding universal stress UspA family protein n=1 Tax=Streptosporangium lutulentum TaxID=1461250 RepID=A0ABT9QPY3_9ACTN|nr:hypothetical protein [Streptosporangium lutulentum]MDP9848831.1 nucleotide-binding universal stress UspA family protein [Streptosporangium lutulentum]